jgi:flagellar biosynthetic protein FlhB
MAADTLPEQRTEDPTDRRMTEIRKEGGLFHSTDMEQVLVLMTGFLVLCSTWSKLYHDMCYVFTRSFRMIEDKHTLTVSELTNGFIRLLLLMLPDILIITGCVALIALFSVMLQTKWNRRDKWIKLRWDMLNPINGLKRIFSIQGLVNTGKAVAKLTLILPIGYWALQGYAPEMVRLIHMSIPDIMNLTGLAVKGVFWKIMYVLIALAIFDVVYGKWQWLRTNRMTKQEVKDERKAIEGDETMRRKIIHKGLQRAMQRLKKTVPTADVVVTNPTHFAVAIKYDRNRNSAPIVVAKGADFMAARIREIAREHGIPVLERKALARSLYASTEIGSEIPRDLFKAVAEVLAYVYRLKGKGARGMSSLRSEGR